MRIFWMSLAALLAVAAIVMVMRQRTDAAFVLAALAAVAWFLNYRVQMKKLIAENPQRTDRDDVDENINE